MKKMFFLSYLLIGSLIAFTACDDDDDSTGAYNNAVHYDGNSFNINEVLVTYTDQYRTYDDLARIDIDFELETDAILALSLVVKEGEKTPVAGTYTFDANATQAMRIFDGGFENDVVDSDVKSGSFVVSVSGNVYTFDFNLVLQNNMPIRGNYQGRIKTYETPVTPKENQLTYSGRSYDINDATVTYDRYDEDITRVTVNFGFESSIPEVGMTFLVSREDDALVSGKYLVDEDEDAIEPMLVYRAWVNGIDGNQDAESGYCDVTVNGDIYTFNFVLEMENGKELKGNYKGELND